MSLNNINIHNQDNLKDVALAEAVKLIKAELKVPEFTINGWWYWY